MAGKAGIAAVTTAATGVGMWLWYDRLIKDNMIAESPFPIEPNHTNRYYKKNYILTCTSFLFPSKRMRGVPVPLGRSPFFCA